MPGPAAGERGVAICAVLLLVLLAGAPGAAASSRNGASRGLLQSGSCPAQIPRCTAGRCSVQVVNSKAQSVCQRCQTSYIQATDGLNCVCPPGTYEACTQSGTCRCVQCEKGFYCAGGDRTAKNGAQASTFGQRRSCIRSTVVPAGSNAETTTSIAAAGLTTKAKGAKRHLDCVPMPGFYLPLLTKALQAASPCPNMTYSPGFDRMRGCLKCQSGSLENPGVALTVRSDKLQVCQVPPGRYISQNIIRDCTPGTFRTSFARADELSATKCLICPPGTTTFKPGGVKATDCVVVLPGVEYTSEDLSSAQATAAAGDSSLMVDPPMCPYGFYCPGGVLGNNGSVAGDTSNTTAVECPYGTTTQEEGSTTVDDCMVPPGYYVKLPFPGATNGTLQKCPTDVDGQGYYRVAWSSYRDVTLREAGDGTAACTPCGHGIKSEWTDNDETNGGGNPTRKVAASSYSCYIEPGWGMAPTGNVSEGGLVEYRANICELNNYGVSNRTYGLVPTACKPCQRNLITLRIGSTSYQDCVNPAGYGYSTNGAVPCMAGTFAPEASMQPCEKCRPGRFTEFGVELQDELADCFVVEGYGVYDPTASNPWNPTLTGNASVDVKLLALPCPIGTYSSGGSAGSKCTPCDPGFTTASKGTAGDNSSWACTKCSPGYGKQGGELSACTLCATGSYQVGYRGRDTTGVGDGLTCISCVPTMYVFTSSQGEEPALNSTGTTYRGGATRGDECVPVFEQVAADVGQLILFDDAMLTAKHNLTLEGCLAACGPAPGVSCIVQYDYGYFNDGVSTCSYAQLAANRDGVQRAGSPALLYVKQIPSEALGATSLGPEAAAGGDGDGVSAQALSSGMYARLDVPASWSLSDVGTVLPGGTYTMASGGPSLDFIKSRCDLNSRCWGFTLAGSQAVLRGGVDAMDLRSFYLNPSDVQDMSWWTPPPQ